MRVICDGVPQVAKFKRVHRGQTYFQLDDGRLIPADKCQSTTDFEPVGDDISIKPGDIEPVGFERLIGQQVEYEGRTYTLLDYLPACGFCQISGHGETKCVPENQVKGEIP
jgi:hypothetical protein